ncbi:hypothetical protein RCG19_10720 [Neobacillus sp. OS1-2]|uniref:hypothetical protein n=1 Tax=Neobacillus sp. OS1-2 TaxID=3070680 RepID=UPI0027E073C6|nr:hypothetical protein [Neobacillus sp. OS1-2]WML42049.1 hypothetical protein RCG19_10720 [Neobacillus sp. OS1-2]
MKKILLTVGLMLVFGIVSNVNSTYASASEIDSKNVENEQIIDFQNVENGQIIESTVLENGGTREIIKISDDPYANVMMPMDAGRWDLIGDSLFKSRSQTVYSHGGDFKLIIHQYKYSGTTYMYKLVEEDPLSEFSVDDFTGPKSVGIFEVVYRGINGWVDGDDGTAELHLSKLTYPFDDVYVQFWD